MKNSNYICDMKNKYKIGQLVEDRLSNKRGIISEFEIFGDVILYYFIGGGALPENRLILEGVKGLNNFLNKTNDEKNEIWENIFTIHGL